MKQHPEDLSRRLALALHAATALVDRVADSYLRPAHGIGISAFAAMVTIEAIGPARQSAVADSLGVSRAAVTQRLTDLTGRGLAAVAPDPGHRGANLVRLTPRGGRLLSAAWAGLAASDDGLEDGVDLVVLLDQLERLVANAERHLAAGPTR